MSDTPPPTPPSGPVGAPVSRQQAEVLLELRKLSSARYVGLSTAECFAAAVVSSPALFLFYTVDGVLTARFPRPVLGAQPPPIPQCVALEMRGRGSSEPAEDCSALPRSL